MPLTRSSLGHPYTMTRIGGPFLWREFITGARPDVGRAFEVVAVLLEGVAGPAVQRVRGNTY
jgi:hypothetical protein